MAMALVALILVGLNSFIFSMGELWGRNSDVRLFDQHVRAVTRYLQSELLRASLPPAAALNAKPVGVRMVAPATATRENMLTYQVLAGGRILRWPGRPLPEVVCSLQVRRDTGLVMLWHSDLENRFNDDPPRETLVSPFVTAIAYDYFDTDFSHWTTETSLRTDNGGNPVAPQRLRVTFMYGKLKEETLVAIPTVQAGRPNPW